MGVFAQLLVFLVSPAFCRVLMKSSNSSARNETQRVLIVDVRGPTRLTGDGVRVMAMIMDLIDCGHKIDVAADVSNYTELKLTWEQAVQESFLNGIRFWGPKDINGSDFVLDKYDRILIGGKLDLLIDGQEGEVVPPILERLYNNRANLRHRVAAFWDDVPFERCLVKPEADKICPEVPRLVKRAAEASRLFYVLTQDDKARMLDDMQDYGVMPEGLDLHIWPMRIANMRRALPTQVHFYEGAETQRTLITMMGNFHAVNKMMVDQLFESGALTKICNAIEKRNSPVRIAFFGGLSKFAEDLLKDRPRVQRCVEINSGFISEEALEERVFPATRAVLNPFFADVHSGISVKNFESIMSGVPFVTSRYGMHGLSDEITGCADFPMPAAPRDPLDFAQFVIDNVVDPQGYTEFAKRFSKLAPHCVQRQQIHYPQRMVC